MLRNPFESPWKQTITDTHFIFCTEHAIVNLNIMKQLHDNTYLFTQVRKCINRRQSKPNSKTFLNYVVNIKNV